MRQKKTKYLENETQKTKYLENETQKTKYLENKTQKTKYLEIETLIFLQIKNDSLHINGYLMAKNNFVVELFFNQDKLFFFKSKIKPGRHRDLLFGKFPSVWHNSAQLELSWQVSRALRHQIRTTNFDTASNTFLPSYVRRIFYTDSHETMGFL